MEKTQAVQGLAALAQESRLGIFRELVRAGPEGLPAGAVGDALSLPSATLSFHLKELKAAGLVTSRREGRRIIYAADFDAMNALLVYLTEDCCLGQVALCQAPAPGSARRRASGGAARARARRAARP